MKQKMFETIITFWENTKIIKIKEEFFRFCTCPTSVNSIRAKTKRLKYNFRWPDKNFRRLSQFYLNGPFQSTYLTEKIIKQKGDFFQDNLSNIAIFEKNFLDHSKVQFLIFLLFLEPIFLRTKFFLDRWRTKIIQPLLGCLILH